MPFITFIATNRRPELFLQDPSFRYRCENLALALRDLGWQTRLAHAHQLAVHDTGQIAVFHRPALSPRLCWLLWRLRRRGVMLVADFDDLVFDPAYAEFSPAVLNGLLPLRKVRRAFTASRKALEWFDRVTVSTQPLREHLRLLAPELEVTVVPNAIHHSWLWQELEVVVAPNAIQHSQMGLAPVATPDRDHQKVITYFPGTRSHDRDFRMIVPALERLLARHPELRLQITGRLRCTLQAAPGQVVQNERVDFAAYGQQVARSWVNLAPLEDTPFNRCKSALKVIEAGFHGIPTVCSPVPDVARFREAGAVMVDDVAVWAEAIEQLLQPEVYRAATLQLRERVLALADPAGIAQGFLEAVRA